METLIEAVQIIAGVSSSEARLALLLVANAVRSALSEPEALELADALPLELALLVGQSVEDAQDSNWREAREELRELLDPRTVAAVCGVLAMGAPAELRQRLTGELPACLVRLLTETTPATRTHSMSSRPTVRLDAPSMSRPTVRVRCA